MSETLNRFTQVSGHNYIDGSFRKSAASKGLDVIDPATEAVIGSIPDSTAAEVDEAVQVGGKVQKDWWRLAAGFVTYVYLLNPLTYVSRSPYEVVTASLPAAIAGGLVYLVVTLLLVKPARKGGYGQ